jgi:anti-anti-sigma factor
MSTALSIETRLIDGEILVVVLDGTLNITTADRFNQAIQDQLDRQRTKIIVDCRNVEYISSVGLGALVALQARLRKKGGEVKLAGVQGVTAEAIRIVGLDRVLNIYADLEAARPAFNAAKSSAE